MLTLPESIDINVRTEAEHAADHEALHASFNLTGPKDWTVGEFVGAPSIGSNSTGVVTQNRFYFLPFVVPFASVTFDRIGCYVNSGVANSVVRLGLYNVGPAGWPSSLILDAGVVDTSTSGQKLITISQALPRGRYYLGGAGQIAAPNMYRHGGVFSHPFSSYGGSGVVFYCPGIGCAGALAADVSPPGSTTVSDLPILTFLRVGSVTS